MRWLRKAVSKMPKAGEKITCPGCGIKFIAEAGQKECHYCGYSFSGKSKGLKKRSRVELSLCPFSWITQERGCLMSQKVWEPVKCLGLRCQLWNTKREDCVFNSLANK